MRRKLAIQVVPGDRVLIEGERHIAIGRPMATGTGVTVATVPDSDRNVDDVLTEFGHNDDVELW